MKIFRLIIASIAAICLTSTLGSCSPKNDEDRQSVDYEWLQKNVDFYNAQQELKNDDGTLYYTKIVPLWNSEASILLHYFNDPAETAFNLQPLYTSKVRVEYEGKLYDGTVFDDSYSTADGTATFAVNSVIEGWVIALCNIHVGDKVRIVVPSAQGYGAKGSGSNIPANSTLVFDINLIEITSYEIP